MEIMEMKKNSMSNFGKFQLKISPVDWIKQKTDYQGLKRKWMY